MTGWTRHGGVARRAAGAALAATLLLTVAGCAGSGEAHDEAAEAEVVGTEGAFADGMDATIREWRTSYRASSMAFSVPGTVVAAAIGDGEVQLAPNGVGAPGTPIEGGDAFHIGSMTKLFTAALVMQLDEEGVLSLDDPLSTWFPEAPNADAITVRMLLQHESGLYELDFDLVGVATPQQLIENVFEQTPIAAPGTEYQYLNAGYIILGRIAEEASGRRYQDLVQARFIEKLHLADTYLDGYGTGPEALDGFDLACAAGTGSDCLGQPSTTVPTEPSPQWTGAWAAGGMVSTARDQAVWIRALVSGDVLDEAHKAEMRTLTPLSAEYYSAAYAAAKVPPVQLGEGTGLTSWEVPGVGVCYGHAGEIPGSNGIAAYCPARQLSIVVLNDILPAGTSPGYPGLVELAPQAWRVLTHGPEQPAARPAAPAGELPAATQERLQAAVEQVMAEYEVPGAAAGVWVPGQGSWTQAFGLADVEAETPVTTAMTWPIRSITKSYTVTLLLQLADEGRVSLDDTLDQYVDGVTDGDRITLLELANMSSGVADYVGEAFLEDFAPDPTKVYTLDELNAFVLGQPARFDPGTEYLYTNANTNLIGAVIEEVTGQSYTEVLEQRILRPLGQNGTHYITDVTDWVGPHPIGYMPGDDGTLVPQDENPSILAAAGAMFSTLDDGRVWADTLGSGALLSAETQQLRQLGHPIPRPPYDDYAVGMGETNGWLGHNGEGIGFTAATFHDPATGANIVVYMNESNLADGAHPADLAFRALAAALAEGAGE